MKALILALAFFSIMILNAQEVSSISLPYEEIPEATDDYSSGSIISRMIDGLGYRYYWATKDLMAADLQFKPSAEARSTFDTLVHLYGLSETIVNGSRNEPNIRPVDFSGMSYDELRKGTLMNLEEASNLLKGKDSEAIRVLSIQFKNGDNELSYPYWNMINGPIADAIYHTGQVVTFRRSSGNPMNPKVNVFMGKTGE